MDENEEEKRLFLEEQLEWTKEQMRLLDRLEETLVKMREIALYANTDQLTVTERENVTREMQALEIEVNNLRQELKQELH